MEMTLKMPQNYAAIKQEEMQYLDGGINVYTEWWGISVKLSKTECRNLTYGASAATIAAGYAGNPAVVAAIGVAGLFAQIGADGRGMWINRTWIGHTWPSY